MKTTVKQIFRNLKDFDGKQVEISGWIRNHRTQSNFGFINLNDGSFFETIQVVYESDKLKNYDEIQKYRVGAAIKVTGVIEATPDRKQAFEIKAIDVELYGNAPEDYPIQPKRHTREYLRTVPHLRARTNLFSAVFRARSVISDAIHRYFQDNDFVYIHTPLITGDDCEGAGEMFQVTTMDLNDIPKEDKKVSFKEDFYGKPVNLTVSGQIHVEPFAHAVRNVYTFGPTFRAEQSNTQKHASEFWMIEPEMAFTDLEGCMHTIQDMVKYVTKYVLDRCPEELAFFDQFVEKGLIKKLETLIKSDFKRITHKEAIDILIDSKQKFEFKPKHGEDLATEHEKFLTEKLGPVFVYDWPKDIKAFYMTLNDDNETVKGVDLLVPGSGELVGGSQREHRADRLEQRMKEMNVPVDELSWYLDLRRFGGAMTSGFGLGLERLVMYITGVENIRDVSAYPRTPKNCAF